MSGLQGGGFFGSGAKTSTPYGGAQQKADNLATDASGGGGVVVNFQDNRQASGKYATNSGSGMPESVNIIQTDHGSVDAGRDLGMEAIGSNMLMTGKAFDVATEVLNSADRLSQNALIFAGDSVQGALDAVTNNAEWSLQQTAQQIDRAFAFAEQSDRSEGSLALGDLVKYGAAIAALALVVLAWSRKK